MFLYYKVTDNSYLNVKDLLKNYFEVSDRLLAKLKRHKQIFINDNLAIVTDILKINDVVSINLDFIEQSDNIVPTKQDLNIIYEDEFLLVINKVAGIPVHPSYQHFTDSLSNGVKFYFSQINLQKKIRPVNRLDKDTSGIVIFAKNEYIQECLIKQMKSNIFTKEYIAICDGNIKNKTGTISAPIARKENSIIERCISDTGALSITHYQVLKTYTNYAIIQCVLETGRTHQIRVHLSYIGHPLLGDTLYGKASQLINRQALHAYKIRFIHPISKKNLEFYAPLPNDMKKLYI